MCFKTAFTAPSAGQTRVITLGFCDLSFFTNKRFLLQTFPARAETLRMSDTFVCLFVCSVHAFRGESAVSMVMPPFVVPMCFMRLWSLDVSAAR